MRTGWCERVGAPFPGPPPQTARGVKCNAPQVIEAGSKCIPSPACGNGCEPERAGEGPPGSRRRSPHLPKDRSPSFAGAQEGERECVGAKHVLHFTSSRNDSTVGLPADLWGHQEDERGRSACRTRRAFPRSAPTYSSKGQFTTRTFTGVALSQCRPRPARPAPSGSAVTGARTAWRRTRPGSRRPPPTRRSPAWGPPCG